MTFPEIQFLSDVLPFFEGRSDFSVQAHDDYIAIHYAYADGDTFDLRMHIINAATGIDPRLPRIKGTDTPQFTGAAS